MSRLDESSLKWTAPPTRPRLLVSVRNAVEAEDALAGGADIIDVKEPSNGPLGRADRQTVEEVVAVVAGRAPVSAAAGELADTPPQALSAWLPRGGLELVKCGLAGTGGDWRRHWAGFVTTVGRPEQCVPVAYADWRSVPAPAPEEVARAAVETGCRWLLVDTFNKDKPGLLEVFSLPDVARLLDDSRLRGLRVAWAGRLSETDLARLVPLAPEVLGVRGAACDAGRLTAICPVSVRRLRGLLGPMAASAAKMSS